MSADTVFCCHNEHAPGRKCRNKVVATEPWVWLCRKHADEKARVILANRDVVWAIGWWMLDGPCDPAAVVPCAPADGNT